MSSINKFMCGSLLAFGLSVSYGAGAAGKLSPIYFDDFNKSCVSTGCRVQGTLGFDLDTTPQPGSWTSSSPCPHAKCNVAVVLRFTQRTGSYGYLSPFFAQIPAHTTSMTWAEIMDRFKSSFAIPNQRWLSAGVSDTDADSDFEMCFGVLEINSNNFTLYPGTTCSRVPDPPTVCTMPPGVTEFDFGTMTPVDSNGASITKDFSETCNAPARVVYRLQESADGTLQVSDGVTAKFTLDGNPLGNPVDLAFGLNRHRLKVELTNPSRWFGNVWYSTILIREYI